MLKIGFIFGVFAVAANVFFIWYAKKSSRYRKANQTKAIVDASRIDPKGFLDSEEGLKLKQSAATELGISVEELDRLSIDEITDLAKINELIE